MLRLIVALLAITMAAPHAPCQAPPDSWENLHKLRDREKIKVVDIQLKSWTGNFVGVSAEALVVRTFDGVVTMERARVLRVSSIDRSKRLRNAGIAFAACGLTTAGLTARKWKGYAGLLGAWAGGICAGGVALIPHYPTIHRSSLRPGNSSAGPQGPSESQPRSNSGTKGEE